MSVGDQEGTTATNLTADQTLNTLALKDWIEPRFQASDFQFTLEEGNHGTNISRRVERAVEWVEENSK